MSCEAKCLCLGSEGLEEGSLISKLSASFENDHVPFFHIDGRWSIANRSGIDGVHFPPFPVSFDQLFM